MMAVNLAPGLMRIKCGIPGHQIPPIVRWKYSDSKGNNNDEDNEEDVATLWKQLLKDATEQAKVGMKGFSGRIIANDIHPGALDLCFDSLERAGLAHLVEIVDGDCQYLTVPHNNDNDDTNNKSGSASVLVVTNPPWGVRLTEDMHESWESLRHFLRDTCPPGTEAWVLSGNKEATKHLGLRRSQSMVLKTAQQDLRWIQYKILGKKRVTDDTDGHDTGYGISGSDDKQYQDTAVETVAYDRRDHVDEKPPSRQSSESSWYDDYDDNENSNGNDEKDIFTERSANDRDRRRSSVKPKQRAGPKQQRSYDLKGMNAPMSDTEREEKRNSWYL